MSISDYDDDDYSSESIDNQAGDMKSPKDFFKQKELCIYTMVDKFFKERCVRDDIKLMVKIIESRSHISLRILDWFASKHSKHRVKLNFSHWKKDSFDVRISYDAQLKTYKKRYFDPFRRKKKFWYYFDKKNKSKKILTTIGQLNFFRWAIDKKILEFVKINFTEINEEMKKNAKDEKSKKSKKKDVSKKSSSDTSSKKDKKTINIRAKKPINEDEDDIEIVLSFN